MSYDRTFFKIESTKMCVQYKSTAKKLVRKKYVCTILIINALHRLRTIVLFFMRFQSNIHVVLF